MAFMPWNYAQNEPLYPSVADGFLEKVDDRTNIRPTKIANAIRDIVKSEGGQHDDPSIISRATEIAKGHPLQGKRFPGPTFGWTAMWISEFGGASDLDPLLRHADLYMKPTWSQGGFYYQRNDSPWDEQGNYTYVDPNTGNAMIAYSRLNVKHGQKQMWEKPWTRELVESRPHFDDLYYGQGIDCVRGEWMEDYKAMVATFRTWDGLSKVVRPSICGLPEGRYGVYIDGCLEETVEVTERPDREEVYVAVGGDEVDLVVIRQDCIQAFTSL